MMCKKEVEISNERNRGVNCRISHHVRQMPDSAGSWSAPANHRQRGGPRTERL